MAISRLTLLTHWRPLRHNPTIEGRKCCEWCRNALTQRLRHRNLMGRPSDVDLLMKRVDVYALALCELCWELPDDRMGPSELP